MERSPGNAKSVLGLEFGEIVTLQRIAQDLVSDTFDLVFGNLYVIGAKVEPQIVGVADLAGM